MTAAMALSTGPKRRVAESSRMARRAEAGQEQPADDLVDHFGMDQDAGHACGERRCDDVAEPDGAGADEDDLPGDLIRQSG